MRGLFADCKLGLRLYVRTFVSSLIAVVVLAIGMACVGAFLSLYVDLTLKPFRGLEDSGRVVTIAWSDGRPTIPFGEQARGEQYMLNVGRLRPGATAETLAREIEARFAWAGEAIGLASGTRIEVVNGVVRAISVHRDASQLIHPGGSRSATPASTASSCAFWA